MTDPDIRNEVRVARRTRRLGPDRVCSRCGEPSHLRAQADGELLCYACRRLIGGAKPTEVDHLAGRTNLGGLTAVLLSNDHRSITDIRLRLGVDRWPAGDVDPLLSLAHLLAGVASLLVLVAEWLVDQATTLRAPVTRPFPVVA
ncbi:MAG TPA: hypothetical protein VE011_00565 [Candidatus Dormibacteraeota bacterium]|nr:hypothetical protein [Candidatus Dormibacteraeota bacterium]